MKEKIFLQFQATQNLIKDKNYNSCTLKNKDYLTIVRGLLLIVM